jgi:type IX secretion system PorP/SprF family membrane protein
MLLIMVIFSAAKEGHTQDAILSQFFAAPVYLNPAFAGAHKGFNTVLHFRSHPLTDATNISAFNGTVDTYIPGLNGALGLVATTNYHGNMVWTNNLSAVYAYHLQISSDWHMNLGAQAGYFRRDFRWANLDFADPGQTPPDQLWRHSPDFATGMVVYSKRIYGGVALHHLTQPKEGLFGDSKLSMKHTVHLGAFIEPSPRRRTNTLSFNYFVSPNVIYQGQGPYQRINYGMYFGVERIMAGMWYRQDLNQSNTLIFLMGLNYNQLRIGYSYDHSLSGFTNTFHGIHEISLSWYIQSPGKDHHPIRCPSF